MLNTSEKSNSTASTHTNNPVLDQKIRISSGRSILSKALETRELTVGAFFEQYLSKYSFGEKDGSYIMASACPNGERNDASATETCLIIIEDDSGQDTADLRRKIQQSGYLAAMYNTYSHGLTTKTDVDVADLKTHVRKSKNDLKTLSTEEQLVDYPLFKKNYARCVVAGGITYEARTTSDYNKDGDAVDTAIYEVSHNPMHRTRLVFVLSTPVTPNPDDGEKAQHIYKSRVRQVAEGLAHEIGLDGFDTSSLKLTQPQYLPRIPSKAALKQHGHVIEIINETVGKAVDPAAIKPPPEAERANKDRDEARRQKYLEDVPKLHGERLFYALHLQTRLKAGQFVEEFSQRAGLEIRKDYDPDTGKVCVACPFEDELHTPQDTPDMGFFGIDHTHAQESVGVIGCRHDHCAQFTDGDFLKVLLHHGGEDSFLEVIEYCDLDCETRAFFLTEVAAERLLSQDPLLKQFIGTADHETPGDVLDHAYRAISLMTRNTDQERVSKALAKAIGSTAQGVRADIRQLEKDRQARIRAAERVDARTYVVDTSAGYDEQVMSVRSNLTNHNARVPTLFSDIDGHTVRRTKKIDGVKLEHLTTQSQWLHTLTDRMVFQNNDGQSVSPNASLVQYVHGANDLNFPEIVGIAAVPIFGPDGTLRTETGYDPELKVWLEPRGEFRTVPDPIRGTDVEEAKHLLLDIICDIPFSDDFDGDQPLPQHLEEKDCDGHPQANLKRGQSSRANFIAYVLQPFVQALVTGNLPFYVFSKPKWGTGATLLAGLGYAIQTGDRFTARSVADTMTEFEKQLLSALDSGDSTIIFDNVKVALNSPNLEAAATSGVFKGRRLGVTGEVSVSMKQKTVVFTGNNLPMSDELRRRVVPIYLDAATPDPSMDRDASAFKYPQLDAWCIEHRSDLVWACHVLIAYWIQCGRKPGSVTMPSFESYATVLSGILETAGLTGLLDNRTAYMDTGCVENDANTEFIQAWWDQNGMVSINMNSLLKVVSPECDGTYVGHVKYDLDLKSDSVEGLKRSLGHYLNGPLRNQTFRITDKDGTTRIVRLTRVRETSPVRYALRVESDGNTS